LNQNVGLRTERLLSAPILPTLARLSAPGLLLVLFQSMVSIGDTYFVSRLGTEPLAGLALVFPLLMLLQMTSAGAMGGGVSSAIARALGAGETAMARRLVLHALVIAAAMAGAFTVLLVSFGRPVYTLLGGRGAALEAALAYSDIVFAGAVTVWLANTLASLLRGSGNMLVPAVALVAAAVLHLPLSALLVARIGIAGAGIAYVASFGIAAAAMAAFVFRGSSALRPRRGDLRLEPRLFREILRVGLVSTLSAVQTVLTAVILTGIVGQFGAPALAGYGVGVRLELLQIPLVFAVGQAMVALVGTHVGAGRIERAKAIAWTGAALACGISLAIGAAVWFFPLAWVGLFSTDPDVLEAGTRYLRIVAPCFPFLALAISLYFAAQGAGQVVRPVLAGTARLAIIVAGGFLLSVSEMLTLSAIFALIAAAMFAFGALSAWAVATARWVK
jgi:putative MATE family efflux protein